MHIGVSFDVKSLLNRVTIPEALQVIKNRLVLDNTLKFLHAGNMECRRALKHEAGSNKLSARRAKELLVQKDSRAR